MPAPARKNRLLDPLDLPLAHLPPAAEGLRLLHLSDPHIRHDPNVHQNLLDELADPANPIDLLLITGDLAANNRHEQPTYQFLQRLTQICRPRLGCFGVFGNHDSPELRRLAVDLPITWLANSAADVDDLPITILGLDCTQGGERGDLLAALLSQPVHPPGQSRLRILLTHSPAWLGCAADVGIDLVLAGHTHGGQVRLPGRLPLYNSTDDWPLRFTSGILRAGRTMGVVSRGLGESKCQGLRLFCPRHAPLITLRTAKSDEPAAMGVQCLKSW
jgi:hypothetical protein